MKIPSEVTWNGLKRFKVSPKLLGFYPKEFRVGRKALVLDSGNDRFRIEKLSRADIDELQITLTELDVPKGISRRHGVIYLEAEHVQVLIDWLAAGKYIHPRRAAIHRAAGLDLDPNWATEVTHAR